MQTARHVETRQLGNSDMRITPIGIGTWAAGGEWAFGWGPQDDQETIGAIHRGLDFGLNWIDTAAAYGLGHAEEMVAKALRGMGQRPYVFTKCSLVWNEQGEVSNSLKADSLRRELEASLRRLETDVIDLYQIHWPIPDPDIEEGWSALAQFQKEGKVRFIGVSNFNVEQMRRAQAIAPITSLQPPYSLLRREVESEILPFCRQNNIGVIVYSPMQAGLLTGKMTKERAQTLPQGDWRSRSEDFHEPNLSRNLALADLLGTIGARHGQSAAVVALAWTLHNPAVTGAIVGLRRPDQADGVAGALTFRLSDDEVREIEDFARGQRAS